MVKKVTKDLPLQPIPLALKLDHLSYLELADPEFRTPAPIDLLLGGEVFTSIVRDGGGLDLEARHQQLILASDGCCSGKYRTAM